MTDRTPIYTEQLPWYSPETPPDTDRDVLVLTEFGVARAHHEDLYGYGWIVDGTVTAWCEIPTGPTTPAASAETGDLRRD